MFCEAAFFAGGCGFCEAVIFSAAGGGGGGGGVVLCACSGADRTYWKVFRRGSLNVGVSTSSDSSIRGGSFSPGANAAELARAALSALRLCSATVRLSSRMLVDLRLLLGSPLSFVFRFLHIGSVCPLSPQ